MLATLREAQRSLSIVEIAERLRLHPNTVRFHLDALLRTGQARRAADSTEGPGRPAQMFEAHPGMDPAAPRNYLLLADILAGELADTDDPTDRATRAGFSFGEHVTAASSQPSTERYAVDQLVHLLDEMGFAPRSSTETSTPRVELHQCPFLDLAHSHAEVVCSIHLGLMRGALRTLDAPVTVERLEPFAEPDVCIAHLTRTD
ncbi:helix-turn-helix domain-containing protein [Nocardia callitridis]|uniref:Helix-turn-helix domain-containing protein n=1 Tax=Nocardia callitridis TaxID=648753 RepID=A0ABP9K2C3_9NOCA